MEQMNYKQAFETLSRVGFVGPEIDRLWRLRRDHIENEMDRAPLDLHRLEFVRWLVMTGKLTEQLPELSIPVGHPSIIRGLRQRKK